MKEKTVASISNFFRETSITISLMDISEIMSSLFASAARIAF